MRVTIIADSMHVKMFKKIKNYAPENYEINLVEIPLKYPYTIPQKIVKTCINITRKFDLIRKSDVIVAVSMLCALPIIACKKLSATLPKLVVIDIGTPRLLGLRSTLSPMLGPFESLLDKIDAVICFAHSQVAYWRKVLNYDKVYFVPFGIDIEEYRPSYEMLPYIVSGGRSDRDFDTLIEAVKTLNKVRRVYIAYGKDTITFKNPTLNVHKIKNLRHIVLFYELPHRLYIELVKKAALVVIPLKRVYYASGHTALLEAMALGKTVLVSRIPSVLEYIENWKTGVFFNPGDPIDLRRKMEYLLDDTELLLRIGLAARRIVEDKFNLRVMTNEMLKVVNRL